MSYPTLSLVGRAACRLASFRSVAAVGASLRPSLMAAASPRTFARSLWYLNTHQQNMHHHRSTVCGCGCGMKGVHTKGDKELVEFLVEEIANEKKSSKSVVTSLEDFEVKFDDADVTLSKKFNDELIEINLNVNHTVDADVPEEDLNPQADKAEIGEMKSKPNFEVEITKGKKTLSFTCSFSHEPSSDEVDIFNIDEVTLFEGDYNDKIYAVAGDILDGYLYDLFMNMLEERGLSNEFVGKLSDLCTAYEHKLYVSMLEGLRKFVAGN